MKKKQQFTVNLQPASNKMNAQAEQRKPACALFSVFNGYGFNHGFCSSPGMLRRVGNP